jgi:hypothetical protein
MIFNDDDVNLPERLVQALTTDQLVVFVGAGVSACAYPAQPANTYYPNFRELAHEIAKRLNRTIGEDEQKSLEQGFIDRLLGEWDDQKGDVRRHASDILQVNESGQRVDLHRAILRLFAGHLTPRIVTTNFDRLLIRALQAEDQLAEARWQISRAPALPPMRRFSGIGFLHGSVDEPLDMVLTDKDVGRAYMDEGWALRFAHSTFQGFNVLFIGYSLEDPPLRYLSLALEGTADKGRWALLPEPGDRSRRDALALDWQRRHVEPIWYPVRDKDYRALGRTIAAWAADNAMSFVDRRSVLGEFAKSKPSHLKPHEHNRARHFLGDPAALRDFLHSTLDIEWFETLSAWGQFDFLIQGRGEPKEADGLLTRTLVRWMLLTPVRILGDLTTHRATIHYRVFEEFCREYQKGNAPTLDVPMLRTILEFFRPTIEKPQSLTVASLNVEGLLCALIDGGYDDDAFALFCAMLRTRSSITKSPNFEYEYAKSEGREADVREEYRLLCDLQFESELAQHTARELFTSVFIPRIRTSGLKLAYVLTGRLLELRALASRGQRQRMSTEYVRSAIEPHAQDSHRDDPVNFVLDLLRDCWDSLLMENRAQAEDVYRAWRPLDDGLIERLRLYALTRMVELGND